MNLLCEACQAVIRIPAGRVPANTTFRVSCPRCKRKIVASSRSPEAECENAHLLPHENFPLDITSHQEEAPKEFSVEAMGTPQLGQLRALLCIEEEGGRCTSLKSLIQKMGYIVDCPTTADQAMQRLRFNQYHLVILSEVFGGPGPHSIAYYLANLNMSTRRDMFIVRLGECFKTADHWQAFVESVNLVCHPADLTELPILLRGALDEHERLYRVFNECLIAAGKKI